MEKRINKELNDLTNDGYEVIITKKNNTYGTCCSAI